MVMNIKDANDNDKSLHASKVIVKIINRAGNQKFEIKKTC